MHTYTGIVGGGDSAVNIDHQFFWCSAYKINLLRDVGIRFHEGQKWGEDTDFQLEARGFISGCTYGAIKWYTKDLVQAHFREHGRREELIEALQKYAFCLDVDGPEDQKAKIFVDRFDWKYEHKQRMIGTILKIGGLRNQIPFLRAIKDKQRYPIPLEKQQG